MLPQSVKSVFTPLRELAADHNVLKIPTVDQIRADSGGRCEPSSVSSLATTNHFLLLKEYFFCNHLLCCHSWTLTLFCFCWFMMVNVPPLWSDHLCFAVISSHVLVLGVYLHFTLCVKQYHVVSFSGIDHYDWLTPCGSLSRSALPGGLLLLLPLNIGMQYFSGWLPQMNHSQNSE